MDTIDLEDRLAGLTDLPAMPASIALLLDALSDPEVGGEDIERILITDQALSLAVMKAANSVAVGASEQVSSLRAAFARLGMKALRNLVMAHQSTVLFKRASKGFELDPVDAWKGAVAGAIGADRLAVRAGSADSCEAFTAGMLRDCGKLAMDQLVGAEKLADVLTQNHSSSSAERERQAFGIDHAEVGSVLARMWRLPNELVVAIRHHHEPPIENENPLIDYVYCGDMLASMLGYGVGLDGLSYALDENAFSRIGLNLSEVCETLVEIRIELAVYESFLNAPLMRNSA